MKSETTEVIIVTDVRTEWTTADTSAHTKRVIYTSAYPTKPHKSWAALCALPFLLLPTLQGIADTLTRVQ